MPCRERRSDRDPMKTARYPLTVSYMLSPPGITLLVIYSGVIHSWLVLGILVFLMLLIGAFDWLIYTNLNRIAEYLDKSRMAVAEAVFCVLLAAVAVQLKMQGLAELGVIELVRH